LSDVRHPAHDQDIERLTHGSAPVEWLAARADDGQFEASWPMSMSRVRGVALTVGV
jgi:hypothetical protein